ncbi:MAG: iron-sulfur cluster assembly protein, partial [Bdellovibrionota bacterium]
EIPVNIVDLGLVYLVEVNEVFEGGSRVDIRMTLTAPGCGMGAVLKNDVEKKVAQIPGVKEVAVELVFDPAWDRSMMSEAAKLQLGML